MALRIVTTALATAALLSCAAAAATEPRFLTSVRDVYPVLSPDGATLLFQSNRGGRWALYTAAADGSDPRVLLDSGDDPSTPSWSPDGRAIVYVANSGGSTEIFVVNADGSGRRQLTQAPGDDEHPHWGSDGRIYWDSGRTTPDLSRPWNEHYQEVYSMAADGSDVRQHTRCQALCTFASLAPDGSRLLYRKVIAQPGRNWSQAAGTTNSEVFVADLDGGNERNLSQDPAFDGWPVWSPDSQWVAFASNRGGVPGVGQVYVVRADGRDLRQVTSGDWSNVQPSFSPDGKRIFSYRHVETAAFEHGFIGVVELAPTAPPARP
jgi:TolB protein